MVRAITLLLFFSLPSFAGDNLITLQTKGSGSTITIKQVGNGNTTGIYCGLGSFDNSLVGTHNCNNATITSTVTANQMVESQTPMLLRQYSTTTLPSAVTYANSTVSISDSTGKPSPLVYSNGTIWVYMDNTAV